MQQPNNIQGGKSPTSDIAIAGLVLVCLVVVGILVYIIIQVENQAKIDEIENYLPRDIADEWNVQCRFLIHSALKQMNGLAFVSSELIYRIFNSEYDSKQILVNIMDAMTSPMLSNNANEILKHVYNNLREPIKRYYLINGDVPTGSFMDWAGQHKGDYIRVIMPDKKTLKILKGYPKYTNDFNKLVEIENDKTTRSVSISGGEQNGNTITFSEDIEFNTEPQESQGEGYQPIEHSEKVEQEEHIQNIALPQQFQSISQTPKKQNQAEAYNKFASVYEGYHDFPTHDIDNYSYLSRPFIPDYNHMEYSPGYVNYIRDLWKYI